MSNLEHSNFQITKTKGLASAKYITKRRRLQYSSRRVRQGQLDFQSIMPHKVNVQSLPEDIVLRITSKLTLKEAAWASVLSSVWKQACVFHPNLYFGIETDPGSHAKGEEVCSDPSKRMLTISKFIERVDAILKNHCGTQVNKFAVKFGLSTKHTKHINRWVSFAIASKARAVILDLSPNRNPFAYDDNYAFPFQLFDGQNGSYLNVLQLESVTLGPSPDFCGFANLKMLDLHLVILLQDLRQLLSKCCVLEWLSIRRCFELSSLCVPEPLCRLQYLRLQNCAFRSIEFHAPNLTTFEYGGSPALMNFSKCLKLKTAAIWIDVTNTLKYMLTGIPSILPNVETMHVELLIRNEMSGFTWFPLKFISLKHLTMELTCWGNTKLVFQLAYLLEAAPLLEDLHFEMLGLGPISCPVEDVVDIMDLPHYHLKTVCITRFCGNDGQVELAKYILKNASILEHLILKLGGGEGCTSRVYILHGRKEAKERLAPLARDGVLTIL
ncbi:unnamed protein product [Urochloa decumbens]|uniref:At1g61320/AtMIF1 LRR domain-containing protein n=2 Tax=Urochloa decumbens TaxID=240449 RepID=A0ABC8VV47_9POAL